MEIVFLKFCQIPAFSGLHFSNCLFLKVNVTWLKLFLTRSSVSLSVYICEHQRCIGFHFLSKRLKSSFTLVISIHTEHIEKN